MECVTAGCLSLADEAINWMIGGHTGPRGGGEVEEKEEAVPYQ